MVAENQWSVEPSTVVKMLAENRHDSCGIPWGLPRRWQTKRGIRTSLILSCYCHWSPKPVWFWGLYGYREQFNYFLVFRNPKIAARVLTYVKMEPESDDDDSDDNDKPQHPRGTSAGTANSEHFRSPDKCRKCWESFPFKQMILTRCLPN